LAAEFLVPAGRLQVRSSEEGWPLLRAQYFESQLIKSDAAQIIVEAVKADRVVSEAIRSVVLVLLKGSIADIQLIEDDAEMKPARRIELRNTVSFMVLNLGNALKSIGLTGMPKEIADRMKADGTDWRKGVAIQVINNLVSAPADKSVIETAEKSVR
jgi:hypothetical protein